MTSSEYLTPETLTAVSIDEEDYEIPNKGKIRIRSMTRDELYSLRERAENKKTKALDRGHYERLVIVACVIQPEMDVNTARSWQENSNAGEISGVVRAILELSKLNTEEDGEDYQKSDLP